MDTVTMNNQLKLETIFTDADTRTITLPNASDEITQNQIIELSNYIAENNLLIGDKTGAQFGRITKATRVNKITTNLDLTT